MVICQDSITSSYRCLKACAFFILDDSNQMHIKGATSLGTDSCRNGIHLWRWLKRRALLHHHERRRWIDTNIPDDWHTIFIQTSVFTLLRRVWVWCHDRSHTITKQTLCPSGKFHHELHWHPYSVKSRPGFATIGWWPALLAPQLHAKYLHSTIQ